MVLNGRGWGPGGAEICTCEIRKMEVELITELLISYDIRMQDKEKGGNREERAQSARPRAWGWGGGPGPGAQRENSKTQLTPQPLR